jgi:hypothetical protein
MQVRDLIELVQTVDSASWSTKVLLGLMMTAFIAGVFIFLYREG